MWYNRSVGVCFPTENMDTALPPPSSLLPPPPHTDFPSLSCHHGNKSQLTSRKPVSMATTAGRKSDIARQISHLLSASSPLVGENLKVSLPPSCGTEYMHIPSLSPSHAECLSLQVLLGTSALDGLSSAQRHQLTSLLPSVDRGPCGR